MSRDATPRGMVDRRGVLPYVAAFATIRALDFMLTFLLVLQAIIAALLVTVILMQKSEGGGLGMGGSPSGLMSARGAADFLTRSTSILAAVFVALSIGMAVYVASGHKTTIDTSLARPAPAAPAPLAAPTNAQAPLFGNGAAPAGNDAVPLAQ